MALLARLERRNLFAVAAAILILAPTLVRIALPAPAHFFEWDDNVRRVSALHLDSIGWGVAAAIVNRWLPGWWAARPGLKALLGLALTLGSVGALFYFLLIDWHGFAGGRLNDLALITAPAAGTALLLPWLSARRAPWPALRRWAARVADYSYSMYLCHFPLMLLMLHLIRARGWDAAAQLFWMLPLWLLLVWALSALIFHRFERPVTDLRERFASRVRAGPFGPQAASRSPPS